ncbi:sn-glycerol-3-phosphate ABC transporter ATP-binding protein UgpC [Hoeflea sp. G2-23]|uniref:Sn-glycerol-3-phosphate ABC transporter ATP-binding protein UgpC n=1 Tax=Hoeflea algicola TaxID=2983763 RepID=A0ABT3ZA11_9HYPH|nr:sn-glycerol-3-phosphate ABC transporter ATP-binding protein UgpC [Hoeflea algicola]MCY0148592.1 sn-glycerol-3-phosphate ABC transporter ATP-binding protein UgpC [Hoeflea algicola]
MANVLIESAAKYYGTMQVLHDVDITVADGEFVVLVGPSGCGKSTLLRMIAGLESISGGTIRIDGKSVNNVAAKNRDIAMVFQSYALYPHMTVRENMSFSLKLKGVSKDVISEQVDRAAGILGLGELLNRYPKQLSGGQRQRVAMGRAIVRDPSVFLFDEPLSNLDAKLRVAMRAEIKSLHQRLKTTVVYVTHDQIEAMTMADKIVVMSGGRVEQVGPPLELYDNPANRFVAGFLGSPSMNFVEGSVKDDDFVSDSGLRLPLPENTHSSAKGRRAAYGIRPEYFTVTGEGLPLIVDVVEPTGSETQIVGHIGEDVLVATFRERVETRPGDTLHILPDYTHAQLFDHETGRRLDGAIALESAA